MTSAGQVFAKAGSVLGLPFLLVAGLLFQISVSSEAKGAMAKEEALLTFQEFESSCIDLGRYDKKAKQLTVRFVNRNAERFYRYSRVPAEVWAKLRALNEMGGVGEYLNETIVRHPERFPYEELTIRNFKTVSRKEKAGNSK